MRKHPELNYPDLSESRFSPRLEWYLGAVAAAKDSPGDLIRAIPSVFLSKCQGLEPYQILIDASLVLPLATVKCAFDHHGADGLMVISDADGVPKVGAPFPLILINEPLLKGNRTALTVLLRHELIHVEQLIRGDYFKFFPNAQRVRLSGDPLGSYYTSLRKAGDVETLRSLAQDRFLQEVYNEGEAYSREILDYGHRVNFVEAWKGLLISSVDFYFRYYLFDQFSTLADWVEGYKQQLWEVCLLSILYKTQYLSDARLRFLDLFLNSSTDHDSVSFKTGSRSLGNFVVRGARVPMTDGHL